MRCASPSLVHLFPRGSSRYIHRRLPSSSGKMPPTGNAVVCTPLAASMSTSRWSSRHHSAHSTTDAAFKVFFVCVPLPLGQLHPAVPSHRGHLRSRRHHRLSGLPTPRTSSLLPLLGGSKLLLGSGKTNCSKLVAQSAAEETFLLPRLTGSHKNTQSGTWGTGRRQEDVMGLWQAKQLSV